MKQCLLCLNLGLSFQEKLRALAIVFGTGLHDFALQVQNLSRVWKNHCLSQINSWPHTFFLVWLPSIKWETYHKPQLVSEAVKKVKGHKRTHSN